MVGHPECWTIMLRSSNFITNFINESFVSECSLFSYCSNFFLMAILYWFWMETVGIELLLYLVVLFSGRPIGSGFLFYVRRLQMFDWQCICPGCCCWVRVTCVVQTHLRYQKIWSKSIVFWYASIHILRNSKISKVLKLSADVGFFVSAYFSE